MTTLPRSSKQIERENSQSAQGSKPTYLSGVNGLRALGIIAIVLYHLRPSSPAQGGFIGVTLFFVISGFLVSRSLLREIEGERDIAVGAYILRRFVRLWPTMLLVTAFSAIASFFYAPPLLLKMHEDAIPALFELVLHLSRCSIFRTGWPPFATDPFLVRRRHYAVLCTGAGYRSLTA